MRFRPLSPAAAVVAALLVAAPVAASADAPEPVVHAAAAKKKRCALKGSSTIRKNRLARVYKKDSRAEGEDERLYGCLYGKNRRVLLDTAVNDDSTGFSVFSTFELVRLNGRFVAWEHYSSETDDSCRADCPGPGGSTSTTLKVVNLRTRKAKSYDADADALVVTIKGRIAWIDADGVKAADSAGERVLQAGPASSLRVRGSTVSWTANGRRMSEALR